MPKRIQRKRTAGWRMPEGAVYVGRGTIYGNPFKVGEMPSIAYDPITRGVCSGVVPDNDMAARLYRRMVSITLRGPEPHVDRLLDGLVAIRGKDLACWCALDEPCHADVLLELANK